MDKARNLIMKHLDTKYELTDYKNRINTNYCVKLIELKKSTLDAKVNDQNQCLVIELSSLLHFVL